MIEGKKISKLDPIENLQEGCCFPVLSRGATKRITFASLLNNILAKLPDASQEEIDEIKKTISKLEKQIAAIAIDHEEVEELLKNVTFTINGQNDTILEYTAKIREFEQEINASSIAESIRRINSFIPSTATESNKLTDKAYVDDAIQTSTAVNRGNFDTYADLMAYSGTVTRNDYATVGDDETHDHECWRYKWNDDEHAWTPEYRINESPMTQAQLAAINSGITAEKVAQYDAGMSSEGIVNLIYPIGSLYISVNNVNPSTLFGGSWEKINDGYTLQSADSNHAAGTYIAAGLPNITGTINTTVHTNNSGAQVQDPDGTGAFNSTVGNNISHRIPDNYTNAKAVSNTFSAASGETKLNGTIKNDVYGKSDTVQPAAFAVYMWKRTA